MKQRITVAQLQELTPEQQERLRKWWRPENGDLSLSPQGVPKVYVGDITQKDRNIPLLSIGQCIELLKYLTKNSSNNRLSLWEWKDKWNVETLDKNDEQWGDEHTWEQDNPELIDALWQVVKGVL